MLQVVVMTWSPGFEQTGNRQVQGIRGVVAERQALGAVYIAGRRIA